MDPILTLTVNPTIDLGLEVDSLEPEGKNRARLRGVRAGGGGINVARAIVELGGEAIAIHTAGGHVGARLDRSLDEEGLAHVSVPMPFETREAVVLFEADHQRSYHIVPGGSEMSEDVAARFLDAVTSRVADHRFVVASGSLPPGFPDDLYAQVARAVHDVGGSFVLDTSGAALRRALDEGVHLVKPNRREAAEILGREVEDLHDAREVNDRILTRGAARIAITTVGDQGSVVSADDTHATVEPPELPGPLLSDAGAGDSFLAAVTLELARGSDHVRAAAHGQAAAAAALLTPGTELCRRRDAEELVSEVATTVEDRAARTS